MMGSKHGMDKHFGTGDTKEGREKTRDDLDAVSRGLGGKGVDKDTVDKDPKKDKKG